MYLFTHQDHQLQIKRGEHYKLHDNQFDNQKHPTKPDETAEATNPKKTHHLFQLIKKFEFDYILEPSAAHSDRTL